MSSTNRKNADKRHISDYYVTPIEDIKVFLSSFLIDEEIDFPDKVLQPCLDPCAGGDSKNPMSYPVTLEELGIYPDTIDIREDSLAEMKGDFMDIDCTDYNCIITNPPFNQAQEIIEKALSEVNDGGYVIMLLRLNFFGSEKRYDFWKKNMPKRAYVHRKRMSFTADGKTDSIEYMHCVWQKGWRENYTMLSVI